MVSGAHASAAAGPRVAPNGSLRPWGRRPAIVQFDEPGWTPALVCILLYLFVVHSYRLPLGSTAIGVGLVAFALETRPPRAPGFLLWFGAFLLWSLATMGLGWSPLDSWDRWLDFGKLWLISFLVYNAAQSEKQWRIVLVGWLGMFALFPFRGTAFNYLAGISHMGRYAWNFTFQNPNDLAAISLLMLALCMAFVRTPRPAWLRWSARVGAASMPLLIILTGSRGGLLAMGVFFAVLLAFSKRKMGTIALTALAFAIAFPLMPANIKDRFLNMKFLQDTETIGQADSSAEQRFTILKVAYAVAQDHPLFGVGMGNYRLANERYAAARPEWKIAEGRRDAHNTFLTIASETGVPGLLLMSAAALALFLSLWGAMREGKVLAMHLEDPELVDALLHRPPALMAGAVAFLVACIFGSYFYIIFPFLFAVSAHGVTQTTILRARSMAGMTLGAAASDATAVGTAAPRNVAQRTPLPVR